MYLLLDAVWFIWMAKYVLFWLYLWQLKEYHIGRFIDHFRTHKGKKILFSYGQIIKLVLFIILLADFSLFYYLVSALALVYIAEFFIFLRAIYGNNFKKPTATLKTIFLTLVSFSAVVLFFVWTLKLKNYVQPTWLIAFDVLTPLVVSIIVLVFQPFFVVIRNNTLRKARKKMEKIRLVSGLKVIAVTGSYGKTTTKEFLTRILSEKFKVLSTKEHQNSEVGIAKCILEDLKPSHQILIVEVGAYNKGKVNEVCEIIKPKIGIVTGVNEQHLALFGSLNNLLLAEGGGELASILPEDGVLFVNGDNKYCLDLYKKSELDNLNKKIYSLTNKRIDSDIWSDEISVHKNYISFVAIDKAGELAHFNVNVLGKHNIQNLLGAILVAKELGMSFGEIAGACESILQSQAGIVLEKGKHGIDVIDSSYSANPDGVFADLDYLSVFTGKKVIVMPCLIELGKRSGDIHEKIGRKIGETCDLAIITSKDKFEKIKMGFDAVKKQRGLSGAKCLLCDNAQDAYSAITLFCKTGDAVLLEGRVPAKLINMLIV
jgi:UDP-N-acetylmuramoyl-tripeptide--D-alanyl-D-alanine ligase